MKRKSIYDIQEEYLNLMNDIEEADGELTDDLAERLAISEDDMENKAFAYIQVINSKKSFISEIDAEIERLNSLKKRESGNIKRLEQTLLDSTKTFGSYNAKTFNVGTRKSSEVIILDESKAPESLKTTTVVTKLSKKDVKAYLQENSDKDIDWAEIRENKNLKIGNVKL